MVKDSTGTVLEVSDIVAVPVQGVDGVYFVTTGCIEMIYENNLIQVNVGKLMDINPNIVLYIA